MILFSSHMEQVGEISDRDAQAKLRAGDVLPVFEGSRGRRVMVGVRRALGQLIVRSNPAIGVYAPKGRLSEVERAVAGDGRARAKIEAWPVTGTPAYRHALPAA